MEQSHGLHIDIQQKYFVKHEWVSNGTMVDVGVVSSVKKPTQARKKRFLGQ